MESAARFYNILFCAHDILGELPMQERNTNIGASKVAAYRQIVFGKLTKVFPVAIVTYCVQQTGVYTGGPTGVYTGVEKEGYPYPAGARPATARPASPNWPKAAAALALAALSTAFADAKVMGMATSAVSPILNIAGPRVFIVVSSARIRKDMRREPASRAGALAWHARVLHTCA